MKKHALLSWGTVFAVSFGVANAGINYDQNKNALLVTDFPQDMPCTLNRVVQLDQASGWNKIKYDKASDSYTVDCDLVIGANDGSDTYFQIGSKEHPKEALIMNGNLRVAPYWIKGENKAQSWWKEPKKINRLTVGGETDKTINSVIKFAPQTSIFTGVYIKDGKLMRPGDCWGGQLFVYNSKLDALNGKFGCGAAGDLLLYGNGTVLVNAEIANVKGNTCYGMGPGWEKIFKVENTVFKDYGYLCPGGQTFSNCTFSGAGTAIMDYGAFRAEFVNCIFKDNKVNFMVRFPAGANDKAAPEVVCIDCDITGGSDQFKLAVKTKAGDRLPALVIKRHVVIEAADAAGKALEGAAVTIKADQPGSGLQENVEFKTGADGKTPGKEQKDAVLLPETIKALTVDGEKTVGYTYTVTVTKDGKTAVLKGVKPDQSWKIIKAALQ